MKLIFLDIDGVLNRHVPHSNGYSGMDADLVRNLNLILSEVPASRSASRNPWSSTSTARPRGAAGDAPTRSIPALRPNAPAEPFHG